MGRMSRDKGAAGEREVLQLVRQAGWHNATRNFASGADGNGDIAHGPALTIIEVKAVERFELRRSWKQAVTAAVDAGPGYLPVLAHRWNRGPWLGITELDELLALLQLREHGT